MKKRSGGALLAALFAGCVHTPPETASSYYRVHTECEDRSGPVQIFLCQTGDRSGLEYRFRKLYPGHTILRGGPLEGGGNDEATIQEYSGSSCASASSETKFGDVLQGLSKYQRSGGQTLQ